MVKSIELSSKLSPVTIPRVGSVGFSEDHGAHLATEIKSTIACGKKLKPPSKFSGRIDDPIFKQFLGHARYSLNGKIKADRSKSKPIDSYHTKVSNPVFKKFFDYSISATVQKCSEIKDETDEIEVSIQSKDLSSIKEGHELEQWLANYDKQVGDFYDARMM